MNLILLTDRVTPEQLRQMLSAMGGYVKLAVDIRRGVMAGGGDFHSDCQQCLVDNGSRPEDVWGCSWYPDEQVVAFQSGINLRPLHGNNTDQIGDLEVQERISELLHLFVAGARV